MLCEGCVTSHNTAFRLQLFNILKQTQKSHKITSGGCDIDQEFAFFEEKLLFVSSLVAFD